MDGSFKFDMPVWFVLQTALFWQVGAASESSTLADIRSLLIDSAAT